MSYYVGIPLLIVAAILNATVMAAIRVGGGAPDLVFLLVVSWALLVEEVREALLWAVIGGVLQDSLSMAPLGTSALGLVVVAYAADAMFRQVERTNVIIASLVAVVGTVVYHLGILLVLRLDGHAVPLGQGLFYVTLPTVIYNAVLMVPVFRTMGTVHRWISPRRVRLE